MTNDEIMTALLNYCYEHHISVIVTNQLSPNTPSVSNSATRSIIVNGGFHIKRQVPYQFSHEITHVENGDSNILYFTLQKSGIEGTANRGAIHMLVPLYFDGIEPEFVNADNFMNAFAIPGNMRQVCEQAIIDYYWDQQSY